MSPLFPSLSAWNTGHKMVFIIGRIKSDPEKNSYRYRHEGHKREMSVWFPLRILAPHTHFLRNPQIDFSYVTSQALVLEVWSPGNKNSKINLMYFILQGRILKEVL